jgi:hypothetical protein
MTCCFPWGKNQQGQFQAANLTTAPAGGTGSRFTSRPPNGPIGTEAPCVLSEGANEQTLGVAQSAS